jgi:2-(1,2-epoxy-1,2-dihydrophenyl)acetyl-CoA isomerase
MAYGKIILEQRGDVAIIRLNDEKTLNACAGQMLEEMSDAFQKAARQARAIVLTGKGRAFCSGINLAEALDYMASDYDAGMVLESHVNPLIREIRALTVPFITAVNGAAAGVGCSFALMGDLVLAADTSFFLQAFRRVGLVPDGGSLFLLTRAVGRARAMEMVLLGERIPAPRALEWGLINRVVPAAELETTALAVASELAAAPTRCLAAIRKLCWDSLESDFEPLLLNERRLQKEAGLTADHREGVNAFLEKRPAHFTGK